MATRRNDAMGRLHVDDQKLVLQAKRALSRVSTQAAPVAIFDALRICAPIVGGLIGTTNDRMDTVVSHAVRLPEDVLAGWMHAPRQQIQLMLAPLQDAIPGQLVADTSAIQGEVREQIALLQVLLRAGLGEAAGYKVEAVARGETRRSVFMTFALDQAKVFTPRDEMVLAALHENIRAALWRMRLPLIPSDSIRMQVMEERQQGFVLVSRASGRCIEMNLRVCELVARYRRSARVHDDGEVIRAFAMKAVARRDRGVWRLERELGDGFVEIRVHELNKEVHVIGEDLWLVTMEETLTPRSLEQFCEFGLTPRELEAAQLLVETGWSYKEIAEELGNEYNTLRTQVASLYAKLGVHSRPELVAKSKKKRRPS